jgi:hypothetical protein
MARYRVVVEPGAYIHGVGFFKNGSEITMPKDYVPSKTFVPLDQEAVDQLVKLGVKAELPKPATEPAKEPEPEQKPVEAFGKKRASDRTL